MYRKFPGNEKGLRMISGIFAVLKYHYVMATENVLRFLTLIFDRFQIGHVFDSQITCQDSTL